MARYLARHHVAALSLCVALGGTSYAAASLPRKSVGAAQLRNGAVTAGKIARGAVPGTKVRNGSLARSDLRPGTVRRGPRGGQGARGAGGSPGGTGGQGSPGGSMLLGRIDSALMPPADGFDGFEPVGEAGAAEWAPPLSSPVTLRDLVVQVEAAPGVGSEWTFLLGPHPITGLPLISCSISGAFARTCHSGGQATTVAPGTDMALFVDNEGAAPVDAAYSYRAVEP